MKIKTFEYRGREIAKIIDNGSFSDIIELASKIFWNETDIAMQKHIYIKLFNKMPNKDSGRLNEIICSYAIKKEKCSDIILEITKWSLR